jgi:4-amino-4-deoxy-L-arabinose transferase-like glycosyltransferase
MRAVRAGPSEGQVAAAGDGRRRARLGTTLAFAYALILIFAGSGTLPLLDPDEGRNAQIAHEMAVSGDWIVPTYGGLPYLDKPAPYFAMVAVSFLALGKTETAARLPAGLFAIALLLIVHRFCSREYGPRTAALAVAVVATMPMFIAFARLVIFDMPLAFFVTASILAGYLAEERRGPLGTGDTGHRNWYLLSALCAGLATLVKGPVGLVVPALVLLAFGWAEGNRGVARRLLAPANFAALAALIVPWVVAASLQRPDFLYYGLVKETLQRFTTSEFQRSAPFFYYGPVLLAGCYGWSLLLPEAGVAAWRRRSSWRRADRLLVTWAIVVVVFFSLSRSKLPGYVLTAVVVLGVLLARFLVHALDHPDGAAAAAARRGAALLAAISLALVAWLAVEVLAPGHLTETFGIVGRAYERARPIFPAGVVALGLCAATGLVAWLLRRTELVLASFLLVPAITLALCYPGLRVYAEHTSSRALAAAIEELAAEAPVACMQCYPPGLRFYLGRPVALITNDGSETTSNYIPFYLEGRESWPEQMIPVEERNTWLRGRRGPLLLLAREQNRRAMDDLTGAIGGATGALPGGWLYLLLPEPDER